MNLFIEKAVMRNDIGCLAGHEDVPESRFEATQFVSEVFAVHSGHHDIGNQQVDGAGQFGAGGRSWIKQLERQIDACLPLSSPWQSGLVWCCAGKTLFQHNAKPR